MMNRLNLGLNSHKNMHQLIHQLWLMEVQACLLDVQEPMRFILVSCSMFEIPHRFVLVYQAGSVALLFYMR